MKAIVLVRNGLPAQAFEIQDKPDLVPQGNQVRVAVETSGINFADVLARLGLYPEAPKLPSVLGYEAVGRIDGLGPEARGFRLGQKVLAFTRFGGYASQILAEPKGLAPLPDSFDPAVGCALATQYSTAYFASEEMVRLHSGDHVIVHAAAGGVGIALVQLAKRHGCVVFGTAGSDEKISFLKSIGVDHPIQYTKDDWVSAYKKVAKGRKPDVIFDSLGGSTTRRGLKLLGGGGRIVCYGVAELAGKRANVFRSLKTLAAFGIPHPLSLLTASKGIIGVNMLRISDEHPEIIQRCMSEVVKLAGEGEIKPHIGARFRANEIAKAHEWVGNRSSIGKVVLDW